MFNLEKEIPKRKLCEKLKELGYPQKEGGFYWHPDLGLVLVPNEKIYNTYGNLLTKAPTCVEMYSLIRSYSHCSYGYSEIEPNTLALELIWLLENEYIKFK
ncbi:MAG: hypothetical protein DRO67_09740 [Candidatus Asgardarchaeum californiense]|nr:MAG: hypothetical protein DRO67_09740 [Candidatus Asgardarchaeum californiense]